MNSVADIFRDRRAWSIGGLSHLSAQPQRRHDLLLVPNAFDAFAIRDDFLYGSMTLNVFVTVNHSFPQTDFYLDDSCGSSYSWYKEEEIHIEEIRPIDASGIVGFAYSVATPETQSEGNIIPQEWRESPELPANYLPCLRRINDLSMLKKGWYNGAGLRPTRKAVASAKAFLSEYFHMADDLDVCATSRGGVAFEFERRGWDYTVEFNSVGRVILYGMEIDGEGEIEPKRSSVMDDKFHALVNKIIGGWV